jgi:hypothetical protein
MVMSVFLIILDAILLEWFSETEINNCEIPFRWPHDTLNPLKLALTLPTSGGIPVGIICLRTKTTEYNFKYC